GLLAKIGNAQQLAQDDPRVVEAECLIKIARQQISLHCPSHGSRNSTPPPEQLRGGVDATGCRPAGCVRERPTADCTPTPGTASRFRGSWDALLTGREGLSRLRALRKQLPQHVLEDSAVAV